MKTTYNNTHKQTGRSSTLAAAVTLSLLSSGVLHAGGPEAKNEPAPAEKGPPLPLHQIEGNGGIFSTLSAYLVNPPRNGEPVGRPSLGAAFVDLGNGRNLEALTLTETPWERLELGYGYDRLDTGDLPQAIQNATTVAISDDRVDLHNINARLALLKEGDFGNDWLPAVTFGAHYKINTTINDINKELGGALTGIGIQDDSGVDYTLYATKLFKNLPRPVLVNLGVRATKAAHLGLLGFTDDYSANFEGSVGVFLTDRLILAAEYRQKPDDYKPIPGLIAGEDDWWTIDLAYVVSNNFTVAVGYGHFGGVLNHTANSVFGVTIKNEF
ncbi:MAG: DUF3034 family protein [Verrucomicrobiota bacterium]